MEFYYIFIAEEDISKTAVTTSFRLLEFTRSSLRQRNAAQSLHRTMYHPSKEHTWMTSLSFPRITICIFDIFAGVLKSSVAPSYASLLKNASSGKSR